MDDGVEARTVRGNVNACSVEGYFVVWTQVLAVVDRDALTSRPDSTTNKDHVSDEGTVEPDESLAPLRQFVGVISEADGTGGDSKHKEGGPAKQEARPEEEVCNDGLPIAPVVVVYTHKGLEVGVADIIRP